MNMQAGKISTKKLYYTEKPFVKVNLYIYMNDLEVLNQFT